MFIRIISVGQLRSGPEYELCQRYRERLRSWKIEEIEIPTKRFLDRESQSTQMLNLFKAGDSLWLLDERGEDFTTQGLFSKIHLLPRVTFLIGGTDGVSDVLKKRADQTFRLGSVTWPHKFIRFMILEQLYRCQQIYLNHPYHRD